MPFSQETQTDRVHTSSELPGPALLRHPGGPSAALQQHMWALFCENLWGLERDMEEFWLLISITL